MPCSHDLWSRLMCNRTDDCDGLEIGGIHLKLAHAEVLVGMGSLPSLSVSEPIHL